MPGTTSSRRSTRVNSKKRILYHESSDEDIEQPMHQDKENVPEQLEKDQLENQTKRRKVGAPVQSTPADQQTPTTELSLSMEKSDDELEPDQSGKTNKKSSSRQKAKSKSKTKTKTKTSAKQKINKKKSTAERELEDDWQENYLFQALTSPEVNVPDLALDWIDTYEEETAASETNSTAMAVLINLILRSCGSLHLFQPHDLVNLDSASSTVEEATLAFTTQKSHKFPFKLVPVFKKNVLEFFRQVIEISDEKGLIHAVQLMTNKTSKNDKNNTTTDDNNNNVVSRYMSYIVTWTSKLTESFARPLRLTSSEISLHILAQLCNIKKSTEVNLERSKRQLNRLSNKTSTKYKTIQSTIDGYETQLMAITEYFDDIYHIVISKRYKDIDPLIRLVVIRGLSEAMNICPTYFCQSSYLRYFGWLLTDSNNQVRVEITKVLLKLYKSKDSFVRQGLRLFSTKFSSQFVAMCEMDTDVQVRANCCAILTEMIKHGLIDSTLTEKILQLFPFGSDKTKLKLKNEFVKFIQIASETELASKVERNQLLLDDYNATYGEETQLQDFLPIKSVVHTVKSLYVQPLDEVFDSSLFASDYISQLDLIVNYILLDIDSVTIKEKNSSGKENGEKDVGSVAVENAVNEEDVKCLKSLIELDETERMCLLKMVYGIVKVFSERKHNSKDGSGDEETSTTITKFVEEMPKLQNFCTKSNERFKVFLNIWTELIDPKNNALFNYYIQLDKINEYEQVTKNIMQYYKNFDVIDEFSAYFQKLFSSTSGLTSNVRNEVQDSLHDLVEGATIFIKGESSGEDKNGGADGKEKEEEQEEEETSVENDILKQKSLITQIRDLSLVLKKIRQIGDHVNIANLDNIFDLLFNITHKLLVKLNMQVVLDQWKHNFLLQLPKFQEAMVNVYEFILVLVSWKFERLIDVPSGEQDQIEMDLEFECFPEIVDSLINCVKVCGNETKLMSFKSVIMMKYIDLVSSFKLFHLKYESVNKFKHFKKFFKLNRQLTHIDVVFQYDHLLELFLMKEVNLAHLTKVELERNDEEGVHYKEHIVEDAEEIDEASVNLTNIFSNDNNFDLDPESVAESDSQLQEHRRQAREKQIVEAREFQRRCEIMWRLENDFCVYVVKMISLLNLQLVKSEVYQRVRLNADKLGDVFADIIRQEDVKLANMKKQLEVEAATRAEAGVAGAVESNVETNLETNLEANAAVVEEVDEIDEIENSNPVLSFEQSKNAPSSSSSSSSMEDVDEIDASSDLELQLEEL
ncbi:cohesin complex subunit [Lodderomyces elongisporus]|uniref:cohesin complex subunit n=1 Tax=Lodderomyces elongisporus TaxID=36914 RepID=UPI0029262B18|nr:cohesin complex subunit [Lodderomyces elongisporus]WLF79360.1 cohesin complex subunit [Lodderomyces elongisporus]